MIQGAVETQSPTATDVAAVHSPVTLVEIGDSLGEDLGFGLRDVLAGNKDVTLVQAAKGDSGLVQPQFYDWPGHLKQLLTRYDPKIVVVFLGANDVQNFYDNGVLLNFGTGRWRSVYAQRVATLMQEATNAGSQVLWVGMPIMRETDFATAMQTLNGIYEEQAARHPGVTYVSSWPLFSSSSGKYTATAAGADGATRVLRTPDGVHITFGRPDDGAWVLASAIVAEMHKRYGLAGVQSDE